MSEAREHDKGHEDAGGSHGHGGGHGGAHGGGSHEEHEGAPEWLISFADNTALMMGFFVILLAVMMAKPKGTGAGTGAATESAQTEQMLDTAIAIREAFNNPVDLSSIHPNDLPLIRRIMALGESDAQREGQEGREHDVRSIRPSDYYSAAGAIHFTTGSSALSETAEKEIAQLLPTFRGFNLIVEVRGHVSAAEAIDRPDRGMQLSFERAQAVAQALVAQGASWPQLRIIAAGDGERVVPVAYDADKHAANQRVELVVTDRVTPER